MREIQFIHDFNDKCAQKVSEQVKTRKLYWQDCNQQKIMEQEKRDKEALMARITKRTNFKKRFGKPSTHRSEMPKQKVVEIKKERDEDEQDQLDYLGIELKNMERMEQEVKSEDEENNPNSMN